MCHSLRRVEIQQLSNYAITVVTNVTTIFMVSVTSVTRFLILSVCRGTTLLVDVSAGTHHSSQGCPLLDPSNWACGKTMFSISSVHWETSYKQNSCSPSMLLHLVTWNSKLSRHNSSFFLLIGLEKLRK